LAGERTLVLGETKPFLERYQERVAELLDFCTRLLALLKTASDGGRGRQGDEVDGGLAVRYLSSQPKRMWTETKLDEE
jgi:hypothetical protein